MKFLPWMKYFGIGRILFGVICIFAPKVAALSIGERPEEMTPAARSFAAITGTRACTLGALELSAPALDPELRRRLLNFIAAVDTVDVLAGSYRCVQTNRTAAIRAVFGLPSGVLSAYVHRQAAGER